MLTQELLEIYVSQDIVYFVCLHNFVNFFKNRSSINRYNLMNI